MDNRQLIKEFIIENFLFGATHEMPADEESFIESGIFDSTAILELVAFLESEFKIEVRDEEMIPDNLDSLLKLDAFVERKRQRQSPEATSPSVADTQIDARSGSPVSQRSEVS